MKILIIRVSSLGDVVHNMPMLQDILRHLPQAQVDWVVEEAYVDLLGMTQGIRRVIPFALRRWRKNLWSARAEMRAFRHSLQQDAYDWVFDTQGLMKTGLIMACARTTPGGKKVGLGNASEGSGYEALSRIFHDQSVRLPARTHAVARARLVAAAVLQYYPVEETSLPPADFGLRALDASPSSRPAWLPTGSYAVFFHATAGAAKKWPRANWIALGQYLQARGWPLLLPWGNAAEQAEAQAIASQIPGACLLPKLDMGQAVLLARLADLVVGVDTGLTHIAAAACRPTIELYCASPRWKTCGNWHERVLNLGDAGQPPSLEQVIEAVETLPQLPSLVQELA